MTRQGASAYGLGKRSVRDMKTSAFRIGKKSAGREREAEEEQELAQERERLEGERVLFLERLGKITLPPWGGR